MNSKNNNIKPIRLNPKSLPAPVGKYSHVTVIPKNSELYTFSGQIGVDDLGEIPKTLQGQIQNTFTNLRHLLDSQDLTPEQVIKVNIWATEELDWDYFYSCWDNMFGSSYPSMTVAYITALGLPELKLEIELWAAKA